LAIGGPPCPLLASANRSFVHQSFC
jgi:hypothetical protein